MKEKITIKGIIEKTDYKLPEGYSHLTIKAGNEIYFVNADKKYGLIQVGEKVQVRGLLNSETKEIENPEIEWI